MHKIAVVNSKSFGRYYPEHLAKLALLGGVDVISLAPNLTSQEIASRLSQYEYLIASVTPEYDALFFEQMPNLKLLARHGLGYDNVDLVAATKQNVIVTKVPGTIEQEAVAEHTLALMLALVRKIPQADQALRHQLWQERGNYWGRELNGLTIGIIGYGNIGARVGAILTHGFQAKVVVYDPYQDENYINKHAGQKVSLLELLSTAEVISLNAAARTDNYQLLGPTEFAQMKPGVLLVNTARGMLINSPALINGLRDGRIAGYAADVFEIEPIPSTNPLLTFDNVILTPHIGAYTNHSLKGMGAKMVADVEAVLGQRWPDETVNKGGLEK